MIYLIKDSKYAAHKLLKNAKIHRFLLLLSFLFYVLVFTGSVKGAKLNDGTWSQSGAPGTTTITFTNSTALASGDKIYLRFPYTQAPINTGGTNITVTNQTSPTRTNGAGTNDSTNTITITLDATINSSTAITITMTNALSSYTTTTYAQQSVAITTMDSNNDTKDYGVALITNDNTTDVTASVPSFLTMAVNDVTMDLGVLTVAAVASANQTYTVNSNNPTGVTLKIYADAALNNASTSFTYVSDGTVTAGSEEYGVSGSGSGLTVQSPFTSDSDLSHGSGNAENIASSTAAVSAATLTVTYEASISGTTAAGEYDQVVTVTSTTNP